MSKRDSVQYPQSLAQHFDAPDGYVGHSGWLCGYSADNSFLEDAIERFSRRTQAQRAYEGRILIAMLLDPGNRQILATEVPGLLHLAIDKPVPFKLLHAKVAILGYRQEADPGHWILRLVVSTGNWTRETLEKNLDLVWSVDFSSEELKARSQMSRQVGADFNAAWKLFQWLQDYYDLRLLNSQRFGGQDSVTKLAFEAMEDWLSLASRSSKSLKPHFFDNRDKSLLDQLSNQINWHADSYTRNYLAMGSGFYESSSDNDTTPSVLSKIVETLRSRKLLTATSEVDVVANPQNCQAVATSSTAICNRGWKVREAAIASFFGSSPRSLHAKFLFSASKRYGSNSCNRPWVYLGSGNLTGPGFTNKMSPKGGNLEAGVVFQPSLLRWDTKRKSELPELVTNYLPLQWNTDFDDSPEALAVGSDMPEPVVNFKSAPVAYFYWLIDGDQGWLRQAEPLDCSIEVLDDSRHPCAFDPKHGFQWTGAMPREVIVRWSEENEMFETVAPVVDEYGRIAATTLRDIDIDEAWDQLENFPMPPDDEDIQGGDGREPDGGRDGTPLKTVTAKYSVRQMMQLIENIANKQVSVSRTDWTMWCTRLEQCLVQAAGSEVLEEFRQLQINPFSPLRYAPFRPNYGVSAETNEGKFYELTLKRIELAWNVEKFADLGAIDGT